MNNVTIKSSHSLGCYFLNINNESIQIGFTVTVGFNYADFQREQRIQVSQNPNPQISDYLTHTANVISAYELSNEVYNFIVANPLVVTVDGNEKEEIAKVIDSTVALITEKFC